MAERNIVDIVEELSAEVRKVGEILRKVEKLEIDITYTDRLEQQANIKNFLKSHLESNKNDLEELYKRVGENDNSFNYNQAIGAIENISIANENIYALTLRLDDAEQAINGKASQEVVDALISDFENLLQNFLSIELWSGTRDIDLTSSDNTITFDPQNSIDAEIIAALANVQVGESVIIDLRSQDANPIRIILEDAAKDGIFTTERFGSDEDVQVRIESASLEVNGLVVGQQGTYTMIDIRKSSSSQQIDLSIYARNDLSNVVLTTTTTRKMLVKDPDGTITYQNLPKEVNVYDIYTSGTSGDFAFQIVNALRRGDKAFISIENDPDIASIIEISRVAADTPIVLGYSIASASSVEPIDITNIPLSNSYKLFIGRIYI